MAGYDIAAHDHRRRGDRSHTRVDHPHSLFDVDLTIETEVSTRSSSLRINGDNPSIESSLYNAQRTRLSAGPLGQFQSVRV